MFSVPENLESCLLELEGEACTLRALSCPSHPSLYFCLFFRGRASPVPVVLAVYNSSLVHSRVSRPPATGRSDSLQMGRFFEFPTSCRKQNLASESCAGYRGSDRDGCISVGSARNGPECIKNLARAFVIHPSGSIESVAQPLPCTPLRVCHRGYLIYPHAP